MKCPACLHELTEIQVGELRVDVCQRGCGGLWLDAFELQRVDDTDEMAGEALLLIQRDDRIHVNLARKRECPRCPSVKLHRHFFSAKRRVEVDQCPNCGGYWLDAGELDQIRAENAETTQADEVRQFTLSPETIRYLYRLHLEARKGT